MLLRLRHALLLALVMLGLSACGLFQANDDSEYRPLGDPRAAERGHGV